MKRAYILFMALLVAVIPTISTGEYIDGDTMYPDFNGSEVFSTRPPAEANQSSIVFKSVEYDQDGTQLKDVVESNLVTTSVSEFGDIKIAEDMNWTDPSKLDKFFQDNTETYLNKANNIAEDIRKSAPDKFKDKTGRELDNLNPTDFSEVAITQNFEEESNARSALAFRQELAQEMGAKLVINSTIKCYITRKLNNSYQCPIPGQGVTTYGGASKDSKDEAIRLCNEECRLPSKCLPHKNNDNLTYSTNGEYTLPIQNLQLPLNPSQITNKFSFEYLPQNISDIQDEHFSDGNVRSRINISGIDYLGNKVVLYDKYEYELKKEGGKISLAINKKLQRIDLYFYDSYIFDPRYMGNVSLYGSNPSVKIKNISAGYLSDHRYFCPITQFESDARKCDGKIEMISFGGATYGVCIPNGDTLPSTRSPIDGGYYREDTCDASCVEIEECVPTYKHLSFDRNNIPSSLYALEYGCVDSEDNAGCTKDRCKQLFEEDTQPSKEHVWEKDDTVVETVSSGVAAGNTPRPKVDFGAELSATDTNRQEVFIEEMKDLSYQNMVKEESFNVTENTISEVVPEKSAIDLRVNASSKQISLSLLYKPQSDLVDEGKKIYLYPVVEMSMTYRPIKPISHGGRLYYPQSDRRIKGKDKVYLLKNQRSNQWVPFKRVFYTQYYLPIETDDGEIVYKWVETSGSKRIHHDTYDTQSKEYVVYGDGFMPSYPLSFSPNSDKPWEEFLQFRNLGSVIAQEGILFLKNDAREGRTFDQNDDKTKAYYDGYRVHLLSSVTTPLSYKNIASRLNDSSVVYDTRNPKASRTEIQPDSLYLDDRVKLYSLGGKDKKTIYMKMKPKSTEEGHKGLIFMFLHK